MKKSLLSNHKKAKRASTFFLCILCLLVATAQSQRADVVQIFEQVATLIRDNRLAEAEKELTAVLRATPDLPGALHFLRTIRAKQNRMGAAEQHYLRAARKAKNCSGRRMTLAYLYQLKRAPDKAIPQLKEVV